MKGLGLYMCLLTTSVKNTRPEVIILAKRAVFIENIFKIYKKQTPSSLGAVGACSCITNTCENLCQWSSFKSIPKITFHYWSMLFALFILGQSAELILHSCTYIIHMFSAPSIDIVLLYIKHIILLDKHMVS